MAREVKVAREQAEQEFQSFLELMDIKFGDSTGEDKEDDERTKSRIIDAVMYGDLVFNDQGEPIYTPWRSASKYKEPVTFHERTGEVILASDGKGKNALARQTFAMMAKLCNVEPKVFAGMAGTDIKVCEALFGLLMG